MAPAIVHFTVRTFRDEKEKEAYMRQAMKVFKAISYGGEMEKEAKKNHPKLYKQLVKLKDQLSMEEFKKLCAHLEN